jgi:hypothetical protein
LALLSGEEMKYNIGDIVLLNQGRRGDFYRPINGVAIILEVYDEPAVKGYRVMIAGNNANNTYYAEDKDIEKKIE